MEEKNSGQRLSFVLGVVVVILVLAGAILAWIKLDTRMVWFYVSGTPGMKLKCQLEINGDKAPLMVYPIPKSISAGGSTVGYSIENIGDPGTMTVRVLVGDKLLNTTTVEEGQRLVGEVGGFGGFHRVERK